MKKKIMCFVFAMLMLFVAVPAYAISYDAGYLDPVRHYFLTGSLSKTASQEWLRVVDNATESKKIFPDGTTANGYHYSRVTDANGFSLCKRKLVKYSGTASFDAVDMGDYATSKNTIRLRIDNPFYDGNNTTIQLQTKGTFTATKTE